jgi:hypothetical protein
LFEQSKALEFKLKMDLQIEKKKKKEKTSLGPTLLGPACLSPPAPLFLFTWVEAQL